MIPLPSPDYAPQIFALVVMILLLAALSAILFVQVRDLQKRVRGLEEVTDNIEGYLVAQFRASDTPPPMNIRPWPGR